MSVDRRAWINLPDGTGTFDLNLAPRANVPWTRPTQCRNDRGCQCRHAGHAQYGMRRCLYRMLGFEIIYGGDDAAFTSFRPGTSFLNLDLGGDASSSIAAGCGPDTASRDTEWGERFFHLTNPDGHELSFAWPLR